MVEKAILRTVLYADVFSYPLTLQELHRYLICESPIDIDALTHTLNTSRWLQSQITQCDGFIALHTRTDIIRLRQARQQHAHHLLRIAQIYGRWLASIPFVRMVALTGAVAVKNPQHAHDDIDFMLIVEDGRVWLARAFAIALVRWARMRGVALCPNYVLAENRLLQNRQDLYIAHEIAQMLPFYGNTLYYHLWRENIWAENFLPNSAPLKDGDSVTPKRNLKQLGEILLKGRLGDALEQWEYQRKRHRLKQQENALSSAEINRQSVKGHFNDHGQRVLLAYQERLEAFGCL